MDGCGVAIGMGWVGHSEGLEEDSPELAQFCLLLSREIAALTSGGRHLLEEGVVFRGETGLGEHRRGVRASGRGDEFVEERATAQDGKEEDVGCRR